MSCLTDDKTTLGMVRVETNKVIVACNDTLKGIRAYRSKARREYCQEWLKSATTSWKRFWWMFRKPTFRDAIYSYYHSDRGFPRTIVRLSHKLQELECKKILRAAQATTGVSMWLSVDGVNICNL